MQCFCILFQLSHIPTKSWNSEILHQINSKGGVSQNLCPGHVECQRDSKSITEINVHSLLDYCNFLTQFHCPNNNIQALPDGLFEAIPNLFSLELANNFIEIIPKSIGKCPELKWIGLSYNNLTDLPEEITACKKVLRVDLSGNLMKSVPSCLCKMTWVERLYVNHMMLQELPENIGDMKSLVMFSANGNCLTKLPKSLCNLKQLTNLSLCGVKWYQGQGEKTLLSFNDFVKFLVRENIQAWFDVHAEVIFLFL